MFLVVEKDQLDEYMKMPSIQALQENIQLILVQLPSNNYEVAAGLDVCKLLAEHIQFNLYVTL